MASQACQLFTIQILFFSSGVVGGFYDLASHACFGKRIPFLPNDYIWLLPVGKGNLSLYDVSKELLWCCIVATFAKGHVSVNVVWLAL